MPCLPAWSTNPTSNDHSLLIFRTCRHIHGCLMPKCIGLSARELGEGGHRIYVVGKVGDWICNTVWATWYPEWPSSESTPVSRRGRDTSVPGDGGVGVEESSFNKCMNESEANFLSTWVEKSVSGLLPVDEKRETMLGWIEFENMRIELQGEVGKSESWGESHGHQVTKSPKRPKREFKGHWNVYLRVVAKSRLANTQSLWWWIPGQVWLGHR